MPGIVVFLYADDILLLSPTVIKLQELLNIIECELQAIAKKSCCLRIGSIWRKINYSITNATADYFGFWAKVFGNDSN